MIEIKYNKKLVRIILGVVILVLYSTAGLIYNPFIIWTILPIYIGYPLLAEAWRNHANNRINGSYAFLVISLGFSIYYHLAWLFDWDGMQTASSTSALLFLYFPVIAVILGFFGYILVYIASRIYNSFAVSKSAEKIV